MAVNPLNLQVALEAFFASPPIVLLPTGELNDPGTRSACGQKWGEIMRDYAANVVPVSATVNAAASQLGSSMTSAFSSATAIADVEAAFAQFAATVGVGMAPAFTATPPASPVGFAAQMLIPQPTHAAAAAAFAGLIHAWFTSGQAVPSGGGPSTPWS